MDRMWVRTGRAWVSSPLSDLVSSARPFWVTTVKLRR